MSSYPAVPGWLSRRRVIWVINSSSSSMHDRVEVRAQSRRLVPVWLARYAMGAYFAHIHPSRAVTHRLETLTRSKPTVGGTVKWEARFCSAGGRQVWRAPARN